MNYLLLKKTNCVNIIKTRIFYKKAMYKFLYFIEIS